MRKKIDMEFGAGRRGGGAERESATKGLLTPGACATIPLFMKTVAEIPKPIAKILKQLTPAEVREVLRFAVFLKTKAAIDVEQGYYWTRGWQKMENKVVQDKKLGRILGDGTVETLLASLH